MSQRIVNTEKAWSHTWVFFEKPHRGRVVKTMPCKSPQDSENPKGFWQIGEKSGKEFRPQKKKEQVVSADIVPSRVETKGRWPGTF